MLPSSPVTGRRPRARTLGKREMGATAICGLLVAAMLQRTSPAHSANVLALTLHDAPSHFVAFEPLIARLVEAGHNVTVVAHMRPRDPPAGAAYRYVGLGGRSSHSGARVPIPRHLRSSLAELAVLRGLNGRYAQFLRNAQLRRLTESGERFDLVITETFVSRIDLAVVEKLKAPFVLVSSTDLFPHTGCNLAACPNPACELWPHSGYRHRMTFYQRLWHAVETWISTAWLNLLVDSDSQTMAEKLFDSPCSLKRFEKMASLVLLYSHFSFKHARSLPPNIIEIGGLAIRQPRRLHPDLEKFINESKDGVVYFCMGSLLRGESFPEEKRNAFLYAFSKIPQRVVWKWEGNELPGKTDNIRTSKWMPQRDILAHPNIKLFISHGGLLGTSEAVYEGVPILGIPIFGDQKTNIKAIEANGAGELLDYNDISNETVLLRIQKILADPEYKKRAKELSNRYRDRPMSPLDTAVYWTEYVIRHKGAAHLKTVAVDMPWYQYLLLDVLAFLVVVLAASLLLLYYASKIALSLLVPGSRRPAGTAKAKRA